MVLLGPSSHPLANEAMLLHGTMRDNLPGILADGFKVIAAGTGSGSAFGDGIYLCDNAGKADQYATVDASYDGANPLHARLYPTGAHEHPGAVFYLLVCRAPLGLPVLTKLRKEKAVSLERLQEGRAIFNDGVYNELPDVVPDSAGPQGGAKAATARTFHYHSLFALRGRALRRCREFVCLSTCHNVLVSSPPSPGSCTRVTQAPIPSTCHAGTASLSASTHTCSQRT